MDNIMNQLWGIVDSVLGIVMLVLKAGLVTLKGFGMAVNDGVMTIAGENVLLAGGLYAALTGLGVQPLHPPQGCTAGHNIIPQSNLRGGTQASPSQD